MTVIPPPLPANAWRPGATPVATNHAVGDNAAPARLREVAEAFEAIFLRQMLGAMREARIGEPLLSSSATEQFEAMQHDEIADSMAQSGNFGIADMLMRQLGPQATMR